MRSRQEPRPHDPCDDRPRRGAHSEARVQPRRRKHPPTERRGDDVARHLHRISQRLVSSLVYLVWLNSQLSASTLRSKPAWIMTNVFGLLPSQSSCGFWPYLLSPGLTISAWVCLNFAFHLLSSVIFFSWLYLAFAHVQTISISSL